MIGDLPQFIDTGHSHTIYGLNNLSQGTAVVGAASSIGNWELPVNTAVAQAWSGMEKYKADIEEQKRAGVRRVLGGEYTKVQANLKQEVQVGRRLVQVFIADPNENVPLEHSLLYSGDQKLTDATDQELFYEVDIKECLEDHNKKRVKWIDKKVKERTEYLEPARIRDLKMIVVTVATF